MPSDRCRPGSGPPGEPRPCYRRCEGACTEEVDVRGAREGAEVGCVLSPTVFSAPGPGPCDVCCRDLQGTEVQSRCLEVQGRLRVQGEWRVDRAGVRGALRAACWGGDWGWGLLALPPRPVQGNFPAHRLVVFSLKHTLPETVSSFVRLFTGTHPSPRGPRASSQGRPWDGPTGPGRHGSHAGGLITRGGASRP